MALSTSLVAYYSLDDLTDATGNGNTLTNNNTATFVAGKVGNAVQLAAASSQYLSRASTANLSMGDVDFSVCAWVYLDTIGAQRYICSKWDNTATSNEEYSILYETSGTRFDFWIAGFGKRVRADTFGTPAANTWYFLACVHDAAGDTIKISVNAGTQDSTATAGSFPALNSKPFAIGAAKGDSGSAYMNGRIDELGIWKRALTTTEITQLYNGGAGLSYAQIVSSAKARRTLGSLGTRTGSRQGG